MVILEEGDPGIFDRGTATRKMVHQLSSTGDPIFNLRVPASRIVGGYDIKNGILVPSYSHSEVIEAVFRRTRVTVGVMTAAKLLSAVEPIIRYQRGRFRGAATATPGSVRHEMGLQAREDALHRLVDIWATGEASSSLAFAAARAFDELDPLERVAGHILAGRGVTGTRAKAKFLRQVSEEAAALLRLAPGDPLKAQLQSDTLLRFVQTLDAVADILCPAAKLWNTGWGAQMMREAVSLMGGYGITEDCPGFLGNKWMDAQLEATYEGPEAVQRRQLRHHDQPAVPRPVPHLDPGNARHRVGTSRNGGLHFGNGHDDVDMVVGTSAALHRQRWRQAVSERKARASPSRWPTRFAGCWLHGARSSMCWNWSVAVVRIVRWPRVSLDWSIF